MKKKIIHSYNFDKFKIICILFLIAVNLYFIVVRDPFFVLYDSEPDYVFSPLFLNEFSKQFIYSHPGTPLIFLVSLIYKFIDLNKINVETLIICLRLAFFISSIIIVFLACNLIKVEEKRNYAFFYFFIFFLTFPFINIWFMYASPHTLNFAFCLYFYIFFTENIKILNFKKLFYFALFSGFLISIYKSNIFLICYFFLIFYFYYDKNKNLLNYFKIFILIFFSYFIFTLTIFPKNISVIVDLLNYVSVIAIDYFFYSIIIFFIIFIFKKKIKIKINIFTLLYVSFCFLIVFKLKSLDLLFNAYFSKNLLNYISFTQSFRVLICIFPIILLYFFYLHKYYKVILLLIFIFSSIINFIALSNLKINKLDNFFESFHFNEKENYFVLQNSFFYSKERFLLWGQYRYGNLDVSIPDHWSNKKNIQLLMFREHELYLSQTLEYLNNSKKFKKKSFFEKISNRIISNILMPIYFINDKISEKYYDIKNISDVPNSICHNLKKSGKKKITIIYDTEYDENINIKKIINEIQRCKFDLKNSYQIDQIKLFKLAM